MWSTIHRLVHEDATVAFGRALAERLRDGDVLALSGPLGAGKSTLARAIIAALSGDAEAPSPTFGLVHEYPAAPGTIRHFDLYRLEQAEDVWELGLEDALADGIALIEWPERIAAFLPASTLLMRIEPAEDDRSLLLRGAAEWPERLRGL